VVAIESVGGVVIVTLGSTIQVAVAVFWPLTLPTVIASECAPLATVAAIGLVQLASATPSREHVFVATSPDSAQPTLAVVEVVRAGGAAVIATVGAGGFWTQEVVAVTGVEPAPPVAVTANAWVCTISPVYETGLVQGAATVSSVQE
jgi:hypothetical protein